MKAIADEIYYVPEAYVHHYIDNKRLDINNFKKLFLKTGNEEKIRIKKEAGTIGVVKKFFEFAFKLGASAALYILFALQGKSIKGRYIFISQYCTFKGFLSKDVFVR